MSVASPNVDNVPIADETGIPIASADGRRVIDALHGLERSAARAGTHREGAWAADVRVAVNRLEKALAIQHHHSSSSDALLPRLADGDTPSAGLVEELRDHYRRIADELHGLGQDLETSVAGGRVDVRDVRHRVERIAEELHYQRARDADFVYGAAASMPASWTEPHTGRDVALEELALPTRERVRLMELQLDRNRTTVTIYGVERAAEAPAPGRAEQWLQDLASALTALENAMALERSNGNRTESLVSELSRSDPRLRAEVQTSRLRYDQLREAVASLRGEIVHNIDSGADWVDLRWHTGTLLASVRHEQARQSDFLYAWLS
jgi:hypothetical protein